MYRWATASLVVALIAAVFGFIGVAPAAAGIGRMIFSVSLILFLLSLIGGLAHRA